MPTCCDNCKWLNRSNLSNPCLRGRPAAASPLGVFCGGTDPCPDFHDLTPLRGMVRNLLTSVIDQIVDAVIDSSTGTELILQDLKTRVSGLEVESKSPVVVDSPQQVQKLPPTPPETTEKRHSYRVFTSAQKDAAIKILGNLVAKPKDSNNIIYLSKLVGLPRGQSQTIVKGLENRGLLKEHRFGSKVHYGVPPDKVTEIHNWISTHSGTEVHTIKPRSEIKPAKLEDPGIGHRIAKIERLNIGYRVIMADEVQETKSRSINDAKKIAWRKGFTVDPEVVDKRSEVLHLQSPRRSRQVDSQTH
jgi:hypothetical protein